MKKTIYMIIIAALGLSMAGCAHFDDMNKNPYAMYDSEAQAQVQTILYKTEYGLVGSAQSLVAQMMQYTCNTDTEITANMTYNYSIAESGAVRIWQRLYVQAGNAEYMLAKAREENNPTLIGVAQVLRAFIYSNIADTYGNVPYTDAGKMVFMEDEITYVTTYDEMKDIYRDLFASLEEANTLLGSSEAKDFDPICDYMYDGSRDKWRRFSNTLYLRLLTRVAMKVEEEDGGVLHINDEIGDIDIKAKISQIYACWLSGSGDYPVMRGIEDGAIVEFSQTDAALLTPFYTIEDGSWKAQRMCETLMKKLYDTDRNPKEDPRRKYYSTNYYGCPVQYTKTDLDLWMDELFDPTDPESTTLNSSKVGYLPYGGSSPEYDLKNCDHYALLNYSEMLFIFAEAAQRGWIAGIQFPDIVSGLYIPAVTANIMEWNSSLDESSSTVTAFTAYLADEIDKASDRLEKIMEQKWIATFFVGIEPWCDYRRTGYPVLKTNGPAAENDGILPTRMRYPADEAYRNLESFNAAVDGWLGGSNNMTTDVWWADTQESVAKRLEGRK